MKAPVDPPLRPGIDLELAIEKAVYRGLGLARHRGQVVFVPRGLPGERVKARVETVQRGYVRARAGAVLEAVPDRRPSPCPFFDACGGCAYQHLAYPAQLRLKEAVLRDTLARGGCAWDGPIPFTASPEEGWRTRVRFHLQYAAGWKLGLHQEGSHRVVDLEQCLQIGPGLNQAARALLAGLAARPAAARRVSSVALAESADGADRVAALTWEGEPADGAGLAALADEAPGMTGLGLVTGGDEGRYVGLHGAPYVRTSVAGTSYRAHALSFFQANRHLLDAFVGCVSDFTPAGGTVLDLYAGVGLFALALAARAASVVAVEGDPRAVDDAEANRRASGRDNVRIVKGDVRHVLPAVPVAVPETVVLDPPRAGAGPDVVRAVAARAPACVVYVSCDPPTLARDLSAFAQAGYRPDRIAAYDLFPDTFHLEAVVRLVPR